MGWWGEKETQVMDKEILSRRHKSKKGKALGMVKMTDKEEKKSTTIIQEWAKWWKADMTLKV